MDWAVILWAMGPAIALMGAGVSWWFARKNLNRERLNQRLGLVAVRQKYFEDIRKWADQLCDSLTEAIHLCDLDPHKLEGESLADRRHRLMIGVSSMTDRGRWFFPNIEVAHGEHKAPGYRGYRHEMLDGLVAAYRFLEEFDYQHRSNARETREGLWKARQHFVGRMQALLDPGRQREQFEEIIRDVTRGAA